MCIRISDECCNVNVAGLSYPLFAFSIFPIFLHFGNAHASTRMLALSTEMPHRSIGYHSRALSLSPSFRPNSCTSYCWREFFSTNGLRELSVAVRAITPTTFQFEGRRCLIKCGVIPLKRYGYQVGREINGVLRVYWFYSDRAGVPRERFGCAADSQLTEIQSPHDFPINWITSEE